MSTSPVTLAVSGTLFLGLYLLYRWLLPKPIPGIPYNPEATKTLFGDVPSMLDHLKTSKCIGDWITNHNLRSNSPVYQLFTKPFAKPWVVICDYREAQDILLRRTKEFDKPDLISDIFYGTNPDHHTIRKSDDQFRAQRKLVQDLMTPTFLNGTVAPQLHSNFMDLVNMWSEKVRLANGRPFSVKEDIFETAMEAIWFAMFGSEGGKTITRNQIALLSSQKNIDKSSASSDEEVKFPKAPAPPVFEAVLRLTDSVEHCTKSPYPRIAGFAMRYMPYYRNFIKIKDRGIEEEVSKAAERTIKGTKMSNPTAVDLILQREKQVAEKQGRSPDYSSKYIKSELFGLLVAGHDTTSTTLAWGMKFFEKHQDVHTKLRSELHAAYPAAFAEGRVPSAHEIISTQCHYLDACTEEVLRCSGTSIGLSRTATTDAVVLGHVIPKGTRIVMPVVAGTIEKPFNIDSSLRNETFKKSDQNRVGDWDPATIKDFNPDRWLEFDQETKSIVFNPSAGPQILFGAGPRGCYGRKLAYMELRMALVLIIWSFEFHSVPERYTSWEAEELLTHTPVQCYANLTKTS